MQSRPLAGGDPETTMIQLLANRPLAMVYLSPAVERLDGCR